MFMDAYERQGHSESPAHTVKIYAEDRPESARHSVGRDGGLPLCSG
jgi:hypothetical protein